MRNLAIAVLIGGCLIDLFLPPLYATWTNTRDDAKLSAIIFVAWAIASVATSQRLMNWKCPRCGLVFCGGAKALDKLSTWFNWLVLPAKCVHCGLPKYAMSPDAPEAASGGE